MLDLFLNTFRENSFPQRRKDMVDREKEVNMAEVQEVEKRSIEDILFSPGKITVTKDMDFDAAHFLPNYVGKCHELHGHRWVVQVAVRGPVDEESGMVVDFSWLKKALGSILERFDHHLVNNIVKNPTAENLCIFIAKEFIGEWIQGPEENLELRWVKVWETPDSMAMWGAF